MATRYAKLGDMINGRTVPVSGGDSQYVRYMSADERKALNVYPDIVQESTDGYPELINGHLVGGANSKGLPRHFSMYAVADRADSNEAKHVPWVFNNREVDGATSKTCDIGLPEGMAPARFYAQ